MLFTITESSYGMCSSFLGTSRSVEYNLLRKCIQNFFPSRKCFTFPFPTAPKNMSCLEGLDSADISSEFLKATDNLCKFVFHDNNIKRLKDGYTVTGRGNYYFFHTEYICFISVFDFFLSLKFWVIWQKCMWTPSPVGPFHVWRML